MASGDGSLKYWMNGLPMLVQPKADSTSVKYWANGLPSVTSNASATGTSFPALTLAP